MPQVRQEYILEAIDQLRRRKSRPDLNRITNYVFRRYSASCKDTAAVLEKLVEDEIVVKVDYKGCTSYRNAAKWSQIADYKSKQEHEYVTVLVCRTVAELILLEPAYLDGGVPYDVLGKYVARKDKRFTKSYFNYILENEIEGGSLVKLPNGNYFVGDMDAVGKHNAPAEGAGLSQELLTSMDASSSSDLSLGDCSSSNPDMNDMVKNIRESLLVRKRRKRKQKAEIKHEGDGATVKEKHKKKQEPVLAATSVEEQKNDGATVKDKHKKKQEPVLAATSTEEQKNDGVTVKDKHKKKQEPLLAAPSVEKQKNDGPVSANENLLGNETANKVSKGTKSKEHEAETPSEMVFDDEASLPPLPRFKAEPPSIPTPVNLVEDEEENVEDDLTCPKTEETEAKEEVSTSKRVDLVDLNLNGRRKRSKKVVFDPSDNNLPKVKRCKKGKPPSAVKSSPPGSKNNSPNKQPRKNSCDSIEKVKKSDVNHSTSIFQPVCSICDCTEKEVNGSLDSFISCTDCITKVHLKCFEETKSPGSFWKVNTSHWQCSNCKTCSVCEDSAEVDKLLICYACDEAYHAVCHDTISSCKTKISKENDKWICRGCFLASQIALVDEAMKARAERTECAEEILSAKIEPASLPPSLNCSRADTDTESVDHKESVNIESCFNDPFEGHPIDESIPDASKWSCEDVYKYFTKYFQQSIAEIFKHQEIDGLSLLLMKRHNILHDFNLKLGPALKVYGHVRRLQIRRTAPQLLWL
ncbi:unnamed protein product [Bemisia tabaci]|uniref:Uncharacterized protein n=1 Tax=Bemisia tabaci TaxID=7038 RepID=A0A9P0A1W1_BEMTA|nr:unnamed protein product [Bemisia tabaci]